MSSHTYATRSRTGGTNVIRIITRTLPSLHSTSHSDRTELIYGEQQQVKTQPQQHQPSVDVQPPPPSTQVVEQAAAPPQQMAAPECATEQTQSPSPPTPVASPQPSSTALSTQPICSNVQPGDETIVFTCPNELTQSDDMVGIKRDMCPPALMPSFDVLWASTAKYGGQDGAIVLYGKRQPHYLHQRELYATAPLLRQCVSLLPWRRDSERRVKITARALRAIQQYIGEVQQNWDPRLHELLLAQSYNWAMFDSADVRLCKDMLE